MIVKPISDINFFIKQFGYIDVPTGYVVRWHNKQNEDTFCSPHTFIGNFSNCKVHSTPPFLITEEKQMITDHVWPLLWKVKHKPKKSHSVWNQWEDNLKIDLPTTTKNFTENNTYVWMPIDEESCNNPWHVWIDVIAKMRLVRSLKDKNFVDYVYVFPSMGKYLENVLKEIYPEIKYYVMPKNATWHFKDIIVPSMSNCNDGETQSRSIEWLRDQKYRGIQLSSPKRKIFITRSDALTRQLTNQTELLLALGGFEPVELSSYTIKEQMKIFDEATHIVSTHGAGLVNLLWSQAGTKVIEINHIDQINKKVYPVLSHHCGHDHKVLYGKKINLPHKHKPKGIKRLNDMANIEVDIQEVLDLL